MAVRRQRHPTHIRKIWGAVKTVSDFIPELTRTLRFQIIEEREKQFFIVVNGSSVLQYDGLEWLSVGLRV
ncbi:hypothetical protein PAMP_007776 [Pampus punctatissimus]